LPDCLGGDWERSAVVDRITAIEPFRVEISQAALDAQRRQAMSFGISTLLIRNLHDCVFYEPKGGVHRGRDEIDRVAGAIKATHPDFRYQPIAEPEELGNAGRVRWIEGRPGQTQSYAGTDFIIARDGRIAAVYLFFDKLP
jgi:SnoaL-like domain